MYLVGTHWGNSNLTELLVDTYIPDGASSPIGLGEKEKGKMDKYMKE